MELPPKPSKAELRGRKAKWSKKHSHKKKRYYPLKTIMFTRLPRG